MTRSYVLYIDHESHPAPIIECFHATASRRLSSSVARYPPSTVTVLDSAYCPQCLAFYDASAAHNVHEFQCATCQRCPSCLTPLSIVENGDLYIYNCTFCEYTSKDTVATTESAESLQTLLKTQRKKDETDPFQELYDQASQFWEERKLSGNRRPSSSRTNTPEWSLQELEAQLERKKSKSAYSGELPPIGTLCLKRTTIQEILEHETEPKQTPSSARSTQLQPLADLSQQLLPLPTPLSPRLSRRCRAELAEGRPGILVKPKLNVLEGDSSLPTGHGQWHRKDSSAIAIIPRVRIVFQHETRSILFRVTNPTLGVVRLRFRGSSYTCQQDDVLVDSLSQTRLATVNTLPSETFPTTDTVELKSAEDSILELGGTKEKVPASVTAWNGVGADHGLRLVAQSSSTAWFELVMNPKDTTTTTSNAVSLTMQIDIGNGSWEASLIRPQGENDSVDFDILFAWDQES